MGHSLMAGTWPFISPFLIPGPGLGGSLLMAGVSPTVGPKPTFGFLSGRSTFSDGFLLVDGLA